MSKIECYVTKMELGGYEHTILVDDFGHRYLKLEMPEIKNQEPVFEEHIHDNFCLNYGKCSE